ncbi:MAG: DEAD/DEAH box helicase [Treponema sp.]|jgi:ATP-dependent Lhr-like helicase|nr:DEAD/DEAH box helicase [Treponema sp.]
MNLHYSRLEPFLKEYIYEQKWQALKGIQEETIDAVLDTKAHILVAASTASGKTEACFFPVITALKQTEAAGKRGVEVLYLGPLKALINDQFERLGPIFEKGEIKLWRWHGDVGAGHKTRLLKEPSGVLQITPESLEALLVRRPEKIKALFEKLRFVIIDEVHAFMGTDRGAQLLCQLSRIQRMTGGDEPRRIGLSATLGDYRAAQDWLKSGTKRETLLIKEQKLKGGGSGRRISLAADFRKDADFYPAVYEQCRVDAANPFRKCIIFTNSRLEAEETVAALKTIARLRGEEDHYHVHHGSISSSLRGEAEKLLRESDGPRTVAATATLEMGIDIGKLDRIIQLGSPTSVSAFVQRLGRSGRRTGISQMYFCSREYPHPLPSAMEKIPWTLIKTIAIIQLYLEEEWTEGSENKKLPYSLLCYEIFSTLMSEGEKTPDGLMESVLSLPPFSNVPEEDYRELLSHLIAGDFIEKTEDGKIIIGIEGEIITGHYTFYSIFPEEEEYRVSWGGKDLGKINNIPPTGSGIFLGGKNWKVLQINRRTKEIFVSPGGSSAARIWRGGGGGIYNKVAQRMRQVLGEEKIYPYLTPQAAKRLWEGRKYAEETGMANNIIIEAKTDDAGISSFFLVPWLGSRSMKTLELGLNKKDNKETLKITFFEEQNQFVFYIKSKLTPGEFGTELALIAKDIAGKLQTLPDTAEIPLTDKYDYLLPPELLVKQYAANMLEAGELESL